MSQHLTCVDLRDSRARFARAFRSISFSSSLFGISLDLKTVHLRHHHDEKFQNKRRLHEHLIVSSQAELWMYCIFIYRIGNDLLIIRIVPDSKTAIRPKPENSVHALDKLQQTETNCCTTYNNNNNNNNNTMWSLFWVPSPAQPRGRNVAVLAFVLVFSLVFSPRDLYYRGR